MMGVLEDLLNRRGRDRSSYAPFWPDEPATGRPEPIKHSLSNISSTAWDLTFFPLNSYENLAAEIVALARNSVERNLFLEPAFTLAGLQRIEHSGAMLLCLWERMGESSKLRYFMPVSTKYSGVPRKWLLKNYTHHFAPVGTPLLHRENAEETAETLLRLLGDPALKLPPVLALDWQRMDGKVVGHLKRASTRLGLKTARALEYKRALLAPDTDTQLASEPHFRAVMGKKRYRETQRQLRRLQDSGNVAFEIASTPEAVLDAIEGFLTLEAKGWKGRSGTALYSLKQIAAFSRQAIASLSLEGRCKIYSMRVDETIIAALVCFETSGEFYSWKVTFDEDYHQFSPGVHILMHASEDMMLSPSFKQADSLAAANHSMMNHIWRERQSIGTLLIGIGKNASNKTVSAARAIDRQDLWKERIKHLIGRTH